MRTSLVSGYKKILGGTPVDRLIRRGYGRLISNDVLRVIYYQEMESIFRLILMPTSNCIDLGCHEGNVLERLLEHAPMGSHIAFEPLPDRYEVLRTRFPSVAVLPYAVSGQSGLRKFHRVKGCDALSGFERRDHPNAVAETTTFTVKTVLLDAVVPADRSIALIKIDVEGAEYEVLCGARQTLKRCRPYTIFQHGLGSAEYYRAEPDAIFDLFAECGMSISLMGDWLKGRPTLNRQRFRRQFYRRVNYIFLAHAMKSMSEVEL